MARLSAVSLESQFKTCHVSSDATLEEPESCRLNTDDRATLTLFLIRHGEASHNVLEKRAQEIARQEALAKGFCQDEVTMAMEQARKNVLHNPSLFDAPLSDRGHQEAFSASKRLHRLIESHDLEPPQQVLVSPLLRALETANLVFPDHKEIHVREELRERQTGRPCDKRSPSKSLRQQRPFVRRFSMDRLRAHSLMEADFEEVSSSPEAPDSNGNKGKDILGTGLAYRENGRRIQSEEKGNLDAARRKEEEEDKVKLRARTRRLLHLLGECVLEHDMKVDEPIERISSVAVVTHKAYLRELERGTFDRPDAPEFGNCEIRVYRVSLNNDGTLESAEQIA